MAKPESVGDETIFEILKKVKNIAVVGLSPKENRPSHRVAAYLKSVGYRIIPVRPLVKEILGERAYGRLEDIPPDIRIDMVDIFRRPKQVPPIVRSAISRGILRSYGCRRVS
jgi:predicted CoA-binding protein